LLKKVADRRIQGVFCSTRNDLPDTVVGVFEALVKKVLDIDHSRGIIMGATSDIDHYVNECLLAVVENGDEKVRETALKIVAERMVEIRERFSKDASAVESAKKISELLDLHNLYTSVDRLNLLRKLLEDGGKHKDQCASMKTYVLQTIPKRNILAHVRVQRNGFSRKLVDKKGNELTSDEMRELRRALLSQQEIFEALAPALRKA